VKALDFRVLIKNQWVIVSALVGLVALGTTVVDVFTGKFGSSTVSQPQNQTNNQVQNQVTPQPQPVVNPKHSRQWVIDSAGGKDSDAKDFGQIVNSLQEGDTVQVRAGSYNGPLALAKAVTVTGDTDQKTGARPSVHYSGGTGCTITGGRVTLENLDFSETSEGSSVLIAARSQAVVQIKNSNFVSRGSDCVTALESAQLIAQDCSFRTLGKGYGCYIKGNAKATIERGTFEENRGCVDCIESGSVSITDSKFSNNTNDSKESYSIWLQSTATAELSGCTFTENTIPLIATQGTMTLTNCRIEKTRGGFYHFVLAAAGANTAVSLTNCEFVANQHAVLATEGAKMTIEGCKFEQSGQLPQGTLAANDANILISKPNTEATISNTTLSDIQFAGVLVADQARASLKDTTIQGGQYGINLGVTDPNLPKGGFAELENVTFSGQIGQAVRLTHASYLKLFKCHIDGDAWDSSISIDTGSTLEMAACEVKAGQGNGLEAIAPNSQAHVEQCQFLSFQGTGIMAKDRAKIALVGCTLEQNDVGAQADENGMITLENCTIQSNRTYGVSATHRGYVGLTTTTFTDQANQTFKDTSSSVRVSSTTER
jgi:hypothetical protein